MGTRLVPMLALLVGCGLAAAGTEPSVTSARLERLWSDLAGPDAAIESR